MRKNNYKGDVCSHTHSFALDNIFRRLFQNPQKIVGEYVKKGDTIIDLGCGPGFFTIEMAKMVGPKGEVIAVDLQREMLAKLEKKAEKQELGNRIVGHLCPQESIGLGPDVAANFILAFYMVHETPDQKQFLEEIKPLLKKDGKLLIVEPLFHVSKKKFQRTEEIAQKVGFTIIDRPKKKGGRSLLLQPQAM